MSLDLSEALADQRGRTFILKQEFLSQIENGSQLTQWYFLMNHKAQAHTIAEQLIAQASVTQQGIVRLTIKNPATDEHIGTIPYLSSSQIQAKIDQAAITQHRYQAVSVSDRQAMLRSIAHMLRTETDSFAALMTYEQGKPLQEAHTEVAYTASYFDWYASVLDESFGRTVQTATGDVIHVTHEPVGVTAAITPWNFPLAMLGRKISASLAAGCVMLMKPAPETPLTALLFEERCAPLLPLPHLIQLLIADAPLAAQSLFHAREVRKISFTGSTATGRKLITQSADQIKRLTLELGGNAPFIVFDDANLDRAVQEAVFAKFRNTGQTCIAVNRFLIHERILPAFAEKFCSEVSKLTVGEGFEQGIHLGPLITKQAVEKVSTIVQDACLRGAKTLVASGQPLAGLLKEGYFCQPQVLQINDSYASYAAWQEEIFGPVAFLYPFKDEADALRLANDTQSGLAGYIFSEDQERLARVARGLETGMVGLNTAKISKVAQPFGGIKASGYGREGGKEGLLEYLNIKSKIVV
jgi:succinate-semialdehyde dehydrogenase/glutarate-semialdehyde dehydrogenase